MRCTRWLTAAMTALIALPLIAAEAKKPLKAAGSIELTDPAGDVAPIHSSSGTDYPGLDVVKLSVKSDGKQVAFVATLKDPPGAFASDVIETYIDADNNPKTGVTLTYPPIGGFEYYGRLNSCVDYTDGSSACAGGGGKAKPKAHWSAMSLARYKGTSQYDREDVLDDMGFPGRKKATATPVTGNVLRGVFDYQDLKLKSGQTIRLVIREAGDNGADDGRFPDILLTLK